MSKINLEDLNPQIDQNNIEFKYSFGKHQDQNKTNNKEEQEVEKEIQTSFEKFEKGVSTINLKSDMNNKNSVLKDPNSKSKE